MEGTTLPDAATIHPDVLRGEPGKPQKAPGRPLGVFEQLADVGRLALNLPVYRKIQEIGRGAFGKAYLVEVVRGRRGKTGGDGAEQLPTRVLKKLPLTDIPERQREAAFQEAQLMRKISRGCKYITQFNEVLLCKGGSVLCLVMEFCSGGDLRGMLRSLDGQHLPEDQVLMLVAQVGLALQHCHSRGILHRDVKPENCFFRSPYPGGDLLLGDFGISTALDDKHFAKTCVGSPLYLSPEIVNQEAYSYASDVWSLGVMMYEIAMLEPPFKGHNICQLAFKIVSATPENLDPNRCSPALQQMIDAVLTKDSTQRPALIHVLTSELMSGAAEAAAAKYQMIWPPQVEAAGSGTSIVSSSGLVQRLRRHVAGSTHGPEAAEEYYADDFEELGDDEDEGVYHDDFEEASGSDASYEQDFEEESDIDAEESNSQPLAEFSEESLRYQMWQELGDEGMAIAESLGVMSFLEGMRRSCVEAS